MSNELFQKTNLSFEAKGLMGFVLSLPDDWIVHKSYIKKRFKIGQYALDRIFKELEKTGHVVAPPMIKTENGRFMGKNYFFYDEPIKSANLDKSTDTDYPITVNPIADNPSLQRNNNNKEIIEQSKHTQANIEILNSVPASNGKQLPKWLAGITGKVADRYIVFEKQANIVGEKEGASDDVIEQLINTYAADDRQYPGFMRFETERYFDLQLMMRKFIAQQEKYDERFN